jgi:hypothetical protein
LAARRRCRRASRLKTQRIRGPSAVRPIRGEIRGRVEHLVDQLAAGWPGSLEAEKINVPVGEKVVLNVTSDTNDEVHAVIGGPGYELQVKVGTPAKGEFTIDSPGGFVVESHHLEKIIVILNAR